MREVVGFAAGVTVAAAASILLGSQGGRRLVRELAAEAEPDLRATAEEWRPLVQEAARAVRLGLREVAGALEALDGHLDRLARDAAAGTGAATGTDTATGSDTVADIGPGGTGAAVDVGPKRGADPTHAAGA